MQYLLICSCNKPITCQSINQHTPPLTTLTTPPTPTTPILCRPITPPPSKPIDIPKVKTQKKLIF